MQCASAARRTAAIHRARSEGAAFQPSTPNSLTMTGAPVTFGPIGGARQNAGDTIFGPRQPQLRFQEAGSLVPTAEDQTIDQSRDPRIRQGCRERNAVQKAQRVVAPVEPLMGEDHRLVEMHRVDDVRVVERRQIEQGGDLLKVRRAIDDRVVRRLAPDRLHERAALGCSRARRAIVGSLSTSKNRRSGERPAWRCARIRQSP